MSLISLKIFNYVPPSSNSSQVHESLLGWRYLKIIKNEAMNFF